MDPQKTVKITIAPKDGALYKEWARRVRMDVPTLIATLANGAIEEKLPPESQRFEIVNEYRRVLEMKPRPQDITMTGMQKAWCVIRTQYERILKQGKRVYEFFFSRRT